jgi:hypothetical protein
LLNGAAVYNGLKIDECNKSSEVESFQFTAAATLFIFAGAKENVRMPTKRLQNLLRRSA